METQPEQLWEILDSDEFRGLSVGLMLAAVDAFDPADAGLDAPSLIHALLDEGFINEDLQEFMDELLDQLSDLLENDVFKGSVLEYVDLFGTFADESRSEEESEEIAEEWQALGDVLWNAHVHDQYPDDPQGRSQRAVKPRVPHLRTAKNPDAEGGLEFIFTW